MRETRIARPEFAPADEFPTDAGSVPTRRGSHAVAVAVMPADVLGELRRWRDATLPRVSLFALVVSGLTRALAASGIPCRRRRHTASRPAQVPADRYQSLRSRTSSRDPIAAARGSDPARLHHDLVTAVASGRPIVSLARVTALGYAAQWLSHDGQRPAPGASQPGAPLVFTGIQAHQQLMDGSVDRPGESGLRLRYLPGSAEGITPQSATVLWPLC